MINQTNIGSVMEEILNTKNIPNMTKEELEAELALVLKAAEHERQRGLKGHWAYSKPRHFALNLKIQKLRNALAEKDQ